MIVNRHPARAGGDNGYTFPEVIAGLLILSIAALASLDAIIFAMRLSQRSGEINELNALIESDLAQVRSANDRLVCNDGNCSIAPSNPDRGGYFPAIENPLSPTPAEQANIDFFVNLCSYRNAGTFDVNAGFANQLATLLPAPDGRLQRNIILENGGHRYTVTYTRPATETRPEGDTPILRQVTLVPATVAWCPCVPSGTSAADLCP